MLLVNMNRQARNSFRRFMEHLSSTHFQLEFAGNRGQVMIHEITVILCLTVYQLPGKVNRRFEHGG